MVQLEDHDDGVGLVRLARPPLNALSTGMLHELADVALRLSRDPGRTAVVVAGNERAFAAGADIEELETAEPASVTAAFHTAFDAVAAIPRPVIAAVRGFALGGGLELAMACDLRVAGTGARLGQPEVLLGIVPGGGGTQRLPRLIGLGRALDLLLTAERIDAAEAHGMGIVSRLVPSAADLPQYTERLAARIAALAPLALRLVKEAARGGIDLELAAGLKLESELFLRVLATQDRREAAAAFVEKREPVFTGT